ncbi:MAG: ornithine carbamoyltransferase [Chloroflexi bacterium]|nr:MAG: ornithine carbamoyltransferase [Anaerolineaceae bacterium 4572_32.2]RLC85947.1 MAG: ornithine carbamoyltransferase [Chloroflexota bacterium]HEY72367.1 ornithine carbamoyltransferase [Thermoflexia bacterium]
MNHFLDLADLTPDELRGMLNLALELKKEWKAGGNHPLLKGKTLGLVFQKPSLRTRVSFEMGMIHLGGQALYLSPFEIKLGERESVPDVARVLSRYVDGIMARVFAHADVLTLAEYSRVPVINGLSDYNHPCQGLADFLTIIENKGQDLKGRKLTFIGDGNNVATSLLFGASLLGMDFAIAGPQGYELPNDVWTLGQKFAATSGSQLLATNDLGEAIAGADAVYTDVWTSMGQEEEAQERVRIFQPYQVNQELLAQAKPDVIAMHCLPAHRGHEITDGVCDGPHSVLWGQAENRMHAQKAILAKLMG